MASSLTTFDAFLKENYSKQEVPKLVYTDQLLLSDITKDQSATGRRFIAPVQYFDPQGLGATLSTAQTAGDAAGGQGNVKGLDWVVPYGDYSGSVSIGDKLLDLSKDDMGSFMRDKATEIDGIFREFGNTMGYYVIGNSGHALATFTINSGVCTLVAGTETDIVNIRPGMLLVASANDGTSSGHTLLGSGSIGYVIAVNANAAQFTVSATATGTAGTPASWSGTMYAFRNGDFGGSGATRIFDGISDWVTNADPSSTAFNGVDRTVAVTALSGVRLTSTEIAGQSIESRLKRLITRMSGRGFGVGNVSLYLNPEPWQDLANSLESRGYRALDGSTATFNYSYLELAMAGKKIKIKADRFVPYHTAFALDLDHIRIYHPSGFPKVVNGDGLQMLRKSNSNDYEMRITTYPALVIDAPGKCGRVSLL